MNLRVLIPNLVQPVPEEGEKWSLKEDKNIKIIIDKVSDDLVTYHWDCGYQNKGCKKTKPVTMVRELYRKYNN